MKKEKNTEELHKLFLQIWDERELKNENRIPYNLCFETSKILTREQYRENTCCYSHILPKSKYPEYAMARWNIRIVHPDAHTQYEGYAPKAPRQHGYYLTLLKLHEEGELHEAAT